MTECTLPDPTVTEEALFAASLPVRKPSYEAFYTDGIITDPRDNTLEYPKPIDINDPEQWDNWWGYNSLAGSVLGEWFAFVFRDCQKVLDIGSGAGRPSLYIARSIPEVVGVEPGASEIEYARELQQRLGIDNVTFLEENALDLPFPDNAFDGAYFSYSLEVTGDARCALLEARRIIKPGGAVAVLLAPAHPGERVELSVTDDRQTKPVIDYGVGTSDPITWRLCRIYLKPESGVGRKVRATVLNPDLPPQIGNGEILEILSGAQFDMIDRVDYNCTYGYTPQQLRTLLLDVGFGEVASWMLPSGTDFAMALRDEGLLQNIENGELIPYLRALVRSYSKASEVPRNPTTAITPL